MMEWEGQFTVPGSPEHAIARFADTERMASCVPGVSVEGKDPEGNYLGAITVTFGPKRIVFRGKASAQVDPQTLTGHINGQGAADMRAARFKVRVSYALQPATDAAGQAATLVSLRSEADLQGVIADFARTGGNAVAKIFMEEFARRIAEDFNAERSTSPAAVPAPGEPVSALRLIGALVADAFRRFFGRGRSVR
jgi:carbon monoxide dehydrogenase subunit G